MFNLSLYGIFLASANANTIMTSGSATASIGEQGVTVVISVDASEPIAGIQADWTYPQTEIEIVSVEKDPNFTWFITDANPSYAPGMVRFLAGDTQEHQGVFDTFIIEFNILETATPGDYTLDMVGDVVASIAGTQLPSSVVAGILTIEPPDADGDGYSEGVEDCDDTDPAINIDAEEVCDGIDNNCDGSIDEGVLIGFYLDSDGDGYGDINETSQGCTEPEGYVSNSYDCDDTDATINPDGEDIAGDGIDQDCDGEDAVVVQPNEPEEEAEDTDENEDMDGDKEQGAASGCSQLSGTSSSALLLVMALVGLCRRRR
jgi:hypothetical protein